QLAVKMIGGNRSADFLAPGADWTPTVNSTSDDALSWTLPENPHGGRKTALAVRTRGGSLVHREKWYRHYFLDTERKRGYDDLDDHLNLAEATATLSVGEVLRIEVAAGDSAGQDWRTSDPFEDEAKRQVQLLESSGLGDEPPLIRELAGAADQFVVTRPVPGDEERTGTSIIAGYPWFADWGRDTMIALTGLCLATRRLDEAKQILLTFAGFIDQGMLPNRFPGKGEPPEYNTADASLLFIEAIGRTWRTTKDTGFLKAILPGVDEILSAYRDGTRHGIRADPDDGLVTQGEKGLQLTWMDARIGDRVITPRRGKAVEINALWHSAWCWRSVFASALDQDASAFDATARQVRASFAKFHDKQHPYLADVIDGEDGVDFSLRPNQLFATGCAHPPVEGDLAASVLTACEEALLTPVGLRTLPGSDTRYQGHYQGDQASRDAAYHMGTSWPWLLGPYLRTHLRVRQDPAAARTILQGFVSEIARRGLGSISEVHDGDAPHHPGGCVAQAWSVGELLATWVESGSNAPWSRDG
ncbi:MAG: amylo-alpha-1,6-glucosidase, partial [Phycisphaerales bacterium]|nr:amylo-alpha-1,6-glucosidase [Phycisphaerales bacterium]